MGSEDFFYNAFIYLAAAVVSVPLAKRVGLGSVLGYLLAGIIIGPFGLKLIGQEGQDIMHFAEFGVVMMLFLIGLELQPRLLWNLRVPILGIGGLQVAVTAVLAMGISIAFGLPWRMALAVGLILSLSSTAIVLQTLNEKGLMKTDAGQNSFAILLFQDIAVIPMLAVLPLLAVTDTAALIEVSEAHTTTWVEGLPVWGKALSVFGAMAVIVAAGCFLITPIFRFIAKLRLREIFTAAALLLVIGIAILMSRVGLSPALGTFLAGVVLASSEYRHELTGDIEPFKGLLLGLFFIAVGASIDFGLILREPLLILKLVGLLIAVKFLVLLLLGRVFKMGFDSNLLMGFSLAQGGEFAFVLFSFAVQNRVLSSAIVNPLVAAVAISMALTPLLMLLNERLIQPRFGTREAVGEQSETTTADVVDEQNSVIIAGFGRFGNIAGRLLRANGVDCTVLDIDPDNVEVLRKLGMKVFYGDASRPDLLLSAGADHARLIILAIDSSDKILEMVKTIRKHFPHLTILARANGRSDAYELLEAGVEHVFRETFDTSLRLGIKALRLLGYRAHQVHRTSRTFRKTDENDLRELVALRHDRKRYLNTARQRIEDLEQVLLSELEGHVEERDAGWDTTTLREEVRQRAGNE